jgi:hypothetical protein
MRTICTSQSVLLLLLRQNPPEVNLKDVDERCNGEEEQRKDDEIQKTMRNSDSLPGQSCNMTVRHSL